MASNLLTLGPIPAQVNLATWVLRQLAEKAKPQVMTFLQDPGGTVGRIGDVLLWQGASGKQVIGTLEGLTESQGRIADVVGHIETAQIGLASSLGTLTSLSMATLGVTSLAAGFMCWRMNALNERLKSMASQFADSQAFDWAAALTALKNSLTYLQRYESTKFDADLEKAVDNATTATNRFQTLVDIEIAGQRRLVTLNAFGRCYLLALTAKIQSQILRLQPEIAEGEIKKEEGKLTALTRTMFEMVMGKSPEIYLDPKLQADNVTLALVTEIYQQAHQLGAVTGTAFKDAGDMFEHFRPKIYRGGGWFRPRGRAKTRLLTNLKYLMACLEEVARIESLRLRIEAAIAGKLSFQDLEKAIATSMGRVGKAVEAKDETPVLAFAFS